MATRRTSKKAEAPADATPASVEPVENCPMPEPAPEPAKLFGAQDLAKFLELPKGYDKKELDAVLSASVAVAEDYVGRKITKMTHEWQMAIQFLAGKMYASGSTRIENHGEIPGKIRYFLELVKNSK